MNQKYLQGLSSDMGSLSEAVFFEATPENISAFLMGHQSAQTAAVGTTDNRTFLTAKMGFIDVCPDQEYLVRRLLPIYSKVQLGSLPTPPLKTVSREAALAECQRHFKMSFFAEMECRFLLDGIHVLCSLIHQPTCRLEACQALIYQLVLGLTGKNGKYNYPKAVHLYPPFFDIFCSAKNYKIAPALTRRAVQGRTGTTYAGLGTAIRNTI